MSQITNHEGLTEKLTASTLATIEQFNNAFNGQDVDAIMALMTEDCIFENTSPAPDGERFQGQAAVRSFWQYFFQGSPDAVFTSEDVFAHGDRAVVRWIYHWSSEGHVRGVDVFRVENEKIAEKLSYVKG